VEDQSTPPAEIERKFLVHEPPCDLKRHARTPIRQGYLAVNADGTEARVRKEGRNHFLTVKSGHGESRAEIEVPIDGEVFDRLWPLTRGRRVRKVRYRVPHDGHTVEIDVYRRKLDGLITAEVEFDSGEAAHAFQPPPWLGEEVTGDERFCNQNLARDGIPQTEHAPAI
jgi:CYTH domain-containing protein